MIVPEAVKQADLIAQYGGSFDLLGKYKGKDAYLYSFPDNPTVSTGFPFVFLYAENKVSELDGFEAVDVCSLLCQK